MIFTGQLMKDLFRKSSDIQQNILLCIVLFNFHKQMEEKKNQTYVND